MASEMVDRICDLLMEHGCGNSQQCEKTARAAIAAIREPTEAMQVAGHAVRVDIPHCGTDEIYTAMIDAALRDE